MSFPSTLTGAIDGVTEIEAAHLNNLEEKVGIDNSLAPASLDYMLRNPSSSDPGHKHTAGAFTGGFDGDVFFRDPADHIWKPVGPDSASLVAKTGAQTIAGVKTFSSVPILPSSDPIAGNEATRKTYVDGQVALKVAKTGDTMSGNLAMGGNNITGVGMLVTTGNVIVGASAVGDSAAKVVGVALGTAPSTFPPDMFHMWAADIAADHCAPHFVTELGKVIKLYQQNNIEDAKADYAAGDLDIEAEIIAAFNTTNGKLNSLFAVLENLGFLATT